MLPGLLLQAISSALHFFVLPPANMTTGTEQRPLSPAEKNSISPLPTNSPQLFARQARQKGEWKDLIYREALKMSGSLRQIISGNNTRSQLVNIKNRFHTI